MMAQHLWESAGRLRFCEVCMMPQVLREGEWLPPLSPICPGDDRWREERRRPRSPNLPAPTRKGRVSEDAL